MPVYHNVFAYRSSDRRMLCDRVKWAMESTGIHQSPERSRYGLGVDGSAVLVVDGSLSTAVSSRRIKPMDWLGRRGRCDAMRGDSQRRGCRRRPSRSASADTGCCRRLVRRGRRLTLTAFGRLPRLCTITVGTLFSKTHQRLSASSSARVSCDGAAGWRTADTCN